VVKNPMKVNIRLPESIQVEAVMPLRGSLAIGNPGKQKARRLGNRFI